MVKICEVVDGCEDCPKYGDDCDGDKMTEHTDLISRADAIEAVRKELVCDGRHETHDKVCRFISDVLLPTLPSADVEPTVIRSKTLLPTKDFKEWAKRVRETNPNAVVIPCDAEVISADAVQGEWKIDEYGIYHCPFCHAINNTVYKSFCPNCGARMKGADDETD